MPLQSKEVKIFPYHHSIDKRRQLNNWKMQRRQKNFLHLLIKTKMPSQFFKQREWFAIVIKWAMKWLLNDCQLNLQMLGRLQDLKVCTWEMLWVRMDSIMKPILGNLDLLVEWLVVPFIILFIIALDSVSNYQIVDLWVRTKKEIDKLI